MHNFVPEFIIFHFFDKFYIIGSDTQYKSHSSRWGLLNIKLHKVENDGISKSAPYINYCNLLYLWDIRYNHFYLRGGKPRKIGTIILHNKTK